MRRVIILLWICLLLGALTTTPKAENTTWWIKTYERVAKAVAVEGDIIVAGYNFGAGDVWVLRLDENGNVKWQKTYGGAKGDEAYAVAITPEGDIIVAGSTLSFGAGKEDVWVLRLDKNGNVKWQKTYGDRDNDRANAVTIAPNGDIIVAGVTESFGAGEWDIWILRLDEEGNVRWQKTYGSKGEDWAWAVAVTPEIIVVGNNLLRLSPEGSLKWAKALYGESIKILQDGTTVIAGAYVSRFNIDRVQECSGWWGWDDVDLEVHNTDAEVTITDAVVDETTAQIENTNAIVTDVDDEGKLLWIHPPKGILKVSSTPSGAKVYINGEYKGETPLELKLDPGIYTVKITKEGYEDYEIEVEVSAGTREIIAQLVEKTGYQPSKDFLRRTAEYAIQKAEELIEKVRELGYEIKFTGDYLRMARGAFSAGNYKKAKELALSAWITAFLEWQIQYELEILEKAGINTGKALEEYNSGNLSGAIKVIHSLKGELSGDYAMVFDSVDETFERVKEYWSEGIRLWNYIGDLYSSNERFKDGELDAAKNLAEKALNVVRDIGETAREIRRQLKELGGSIFGKGRGGEKARELFERAMELFERGEFEKVKQVIVEIQEIVVVTTTKAGGGAYTPALLLALLGLAAIIILAKRKQG